MKSSIAHASIVCSLAVIVFNAETASAGTYQVGVAPSTVKVMIKGAHLGWPFEGWIDDHYDLYLARGEHEAMQVVVIATDALTNVSVTASQPQEVQGSGPLNGGAESWLVGHVDVYNTTGYKDYYPGRPDYHGWYPDPLLTFKNSCSSINAGDRVAFWIDVSALREATAGDYVSTITVTAKDSPSTDIQLNIHVWDFELPLKASLPTIFSIMEQLTSDKNGGPRPLYGESVWVNWGIAQQFYDLLMERRMGGPHLYRMEDNAWIESFDNIVDWAARGNSAVVLKNLGASDNLGDVTDPELATLVSQVSEAGLLDISCVYGFDEKDPVSYGDAIRKVFNKVHEIYPGLRTMTTARDTSFGLNTDLRAAVDIWVPQTDKYDQVAGNLLRAQGKDMWWYVCTGPWRPYINLFVEYPAIEPRLLMGAMAYKCQTGGFLYYNVTRWLSEYWNGPITSGPYTTWNPRTAYKNNGDGSLFCAGPSGPIPTIRTENIRDGLEDYEYLKLLENMVQSMQAGSPTAEQLAWISSTQPLLAVPSNVVASLTSFTRDPATLESYREQLATTILDGIMLTEAPTITQQPSYQNVLPGASADFTIVATGGGTLAYQWQKDQSDLSNGEHYTGCTTATLTISSADSSDEAYYRCVVTNEYGSAASSEALLTVTAVEFTQHPTSQIICPGTDAQFTVSATGQGTLTYQWQKNQSDLSNGENYSGCTTTALTIIGADSGDEADYRCAVTDDTGTAYSDDAALTVYPGPSITQPPSGRSVCPGSSTQFTVAATSDCTLSYQWQKDRSDLPNGGHYSGCTTTTLKITGADSDDQAYYRCMVADNTNTVYSDEVLLTVHPVTSITQQPSPLLIQVSKTAEFSVTASGSGTLTYQWQKDQVNLSDDGHYFGCTTATLSVFNVDLADEANYRCVVTGGCGSATSDEVSLTIVFAPGDFDQDGDVDQSDFGHFQACLSGDTIPQADPDCHDAKLNGDEYVDSQDLAIFLGCMSGSGIPADLNCADCTPEDCGPVVTSAVSVKTHGTVGDFVIDVLNRTSNQDIECRVDGVTKLVVTFDVDIQGVGGLDLSDVSLTSGMVDTVSLSASNELTIEISGTTNGIPLTVTFPGIEYTGAAGAICTDSVCIRQLVGDTSLDGVLTALDRVKVRDAMIKPVTASNFRMDVVADGAFTALDRVKVRDAMGTGFIGTCP